MASLFFSYSHVDEDLRDRLEKQLAMFKRQGIIETWHDRRIGAGEEIDRAIDTTDLPTVPKPDQEFMIDNTQANEIRYFSGPVVTIYNLIFFSDQDTLDVVLDRSTRRSSRPELLLQ